MSKSAILLSLLPAIFWLLYLRSLAHYRSYTIVDLVLAFVGGALSPGIVFGFQRYLGVGGSIPRDSLEALYFFTVDVGFVEEFAKLFMAVLFLKLTGRIKEPLDGLLLSGCVALGFATSENVLYVERHGESVLLGRAILSTFGHVLMSSFWGYALGQKSWKPWVTGFLSASIVHGLYDWFLTIGWSSLAVATLLTAWSVFRFRLVHANLQSTSRQFRAYHQKECAQCHTLTRWEALFCSYCGHEFSEKSEMAVCSSCLESHPPEAESCPGCGHSLVPPAWSETSTD